MTLPSSANYLDETETIFGQHLTARYHVIDTWLRRHDSRQIISSQAMRCYEDPAIGRPDPSRFAEFSGTYKLDEQTRRVFADGDKLFVERNGKREQLFPESCDIFFRKGVEGRLLFRTAADGKLDALIDRRNNEDVVWRRISGDAILALSFGSGCRLPDHANSGGHDV
ncbi:MAG TPA: hypothetical protein VGI60_03815 [Chthoniobacterales bacterium]